MFRVLRDGHLCLGVASAVKGAHRVLNLLSKNYWLLWCSLNNDCSCVLRNNVLDAHIERTLEYNQAIIFLLPCGNRHRGEGMPAIIWKDGTKEWWVNGKRHRERDRPAMWWPVGAREWWKEGKKHREGDKPAVVWINGEEWWKKGKRHRDGDKPAIVWESGWREWWKEGERHRDGDNPAVMLANGKIEFWKEGTKIK